ncbi:MAG: type II toxin-antitoxin system PemK/MazF family toxin [Thermoguttaceae bacterium]|jgi:mRNA-degrading endonuclease toxin of MazEF toxin-antitoxin module
MPIRRGQVFFVDLDPTVGREIGGHKLRPVVVLSINDINSKPLVVTVVPGTKAADKPVSFRNVVVVDPTPDNGLAVHTIFQCHQIRAIDHSRFGLRPVGSLSPADLTRVEDAVKFSLGLG